MRSSLTSIIEIRSSTSLLHIQSNSPSPVDYFFRIRLLHPQPTDAIRLAPRANAFGIHFAFDTLLIPTAHANIDDSLRPGMVITDLLTERYKDRPEEWKRAKKIFNIIADRVENVVPWLAKRMLANQRNGAMLAYSSTWKLLWRFVSQPFARRDLFQ